TDEGLQSEGLSTRVVGNAFHDGDNDYRRRRAQPRRMAPAAASCAVVGRIPLLQHRRVLERSEVHDREQYAASRSRSLASMSFLSRLTHPARRESPELQNAEQIDAFIDSRALEYPTKIEDEFAKQALELGVDG